LWPKNLLEFFFSSLIFLFLVVFHSYFLILNTHFVKDKIKGETGHKLLKA